jgi:hypothetical protein
MMTHYERSMKWIDAMFKRYFHTRMPLEGIFQLIEAKRPQEVRNSMTAAGRAFNKALREYRQTAFKAYPERAGK